MSSNFNPKESSTGRGASHAKPGDSSYVPKPLQDELPESVERAVPNAVHDTGSGGPATDKAKGLGIGESHAKPGGSVLPEFIQKAVPEKIERMVPNALHDTGDKKISDP